MLSIALPKGSLEEQTLLLFSQADIEVKKSSRAYNPTDRRSAHRARQDPAAPGDPRLRAGRLLRSRDLRTRLGARDRGRRRRGRRAAVREDRHRHRDMVLAVPEDSPIQRAADIPPGSRITTEFLKATKAFFEELGIDVEVHFSYGATEAKVPEMMDALVDLTETGSTLRRNGLKISTPCSSRPRACSRTRKPGRTPRSERPSKRSARSCWASSRRADACCSR